ncbi:hypothetical protein B0H13DRAFT_2327927 [Mycena leptocephala]|nr:hypothetical protein B0H13DRAFT_2327927 [Mycena leptocephala]
MECAALLFTPGTFTQCAASQLNVPGIRIANGTHAVVVTGFSLSAPGAVVS